jgi:hypothetical protein
MKDWKNDSKHETFEAADARRNQLMAESSLELSVKVKRMNADGSFVVKTWYAPVKGEDTRGEDGDPTNERGRPKTKAQRRALREKRKREREKRL